MKTYRLFSLLQTLSVYLVLTVFAFFMLFPFLYMFFTSFKTPGDTFRYPPRLLPYDPVSAPVQGETDPKPLYYVDVNGEPRAYALVQSSIPVGVFARAENADETFTIPLDQVAATGEQQTVNGKEFDVFLVPAGGTAPVPMLKLSQTALGRMVDLENPDTFVLQNVRTSQPVEKLSFHPENYADVVALRNLDRALTNTTLVTLLVMFGQLATSILGGYAFARLRFPGRDNLFTVYLGTIMIPFVVLITPLYQIMVTIGWVDRLAALIIPWIFTAYGTFLMRQFFITFPKEIEEAALIDGASRLQILARIILPASTPALATLATFTFLYAWNSFFWPLVIINTGNEGNHVLTLALNVLRGRAADAPNLLLAGAAIAILPPMIIFILGQRFFVESATSSGVKG
jgi:ABC-type glycerol-3-phosphate transport system permease component